MARNALLQTRPMKREGPPKFLRSALPSDIGDRIRDARTNSGRTRTQLARLSRISYRTVVRIETGRQRPNQQVLRRIATAVRQDIDFLCLGWFEDELMRVSSGKVHLGVGFRTIRLRKRITLKEASQYAGVSISTLSRFERALHASRKFSKYYPDGYHSYVIPNIELANIFGFETIDSFITECEEANAES